MPKGKQFNAAEKHFQKKQVKYEKELKEKTLQNNNLLNDISNLKLRLNELESENQMLNDWIERLLKYTELSKNDIQIVCENDKTKNQFISTLENIINLVKFKEDIYV